MRALAARTAWAACGSRAARAPALLAARAAPPRRWNQQASAESHLFSETDVLRRQLLYRSKQRGWLEMDIMLGTWARDNLASLDDTELELFQQVIDMENPDLYRYLTGQEEVPASIDNKVLRTLCRDLRLAVAPKVSVASTASFEGKVWE